MKLENIEESRVVSLAQIGVTKGAPFSLDLVGAIVSRYNFQHFPERLPLPGSENVKLQTGRFENFQIADLTVYGDGLSVGARTETDVIEAFLDDLYDFVAKTFNLIRLEVPAEKRHYESTLVVSMDPRAADKFEFMGGLYNDLASFRESYGLGDVEYRFGGFRAEPETETAAVPRFIFERRIRLPFSTNLWFSSAPLRTQDHLAVLKNLEEQLTR